ncbi:tetratricopeptide (TPR) repeat protein [Dysgonomonas sp. PFB1-18]|uniref:tetratricopeptide repeat protein n=1 Tax=unclassified Dysgonomonas TaxID=2630389 RepID=UPI002474D726|nr:MULTISPECIES: tetratricopeptide repeat protein [unclassified Dysgonomonas]MDH6308437.1 tetratricopeptide (TPR) repeat protein [Dysgonomonas sp. PF1-14]MDH6337938.1 tetratricopeptide (TPR) repeat protein [Dysgonomonas sp. PF1-16]MDH6379435.1 tetratricopeptide (TPR) repeat protein [Dysgonomonas sp. PFB1-18]MDH6396766.1 tetratricopeptide (TPR) repeat protein [Dysgonomonas sp. PF1-23]
MKKLSVLLLFFLILCQSGYAQTNTEKAMQIGREAIKIMDEGHYDKSIEMLEEAQKLDPDNFIYPYEIAFAYYLKKDYQRAIKLLKKSEKHKNVSDLTYQLLGNSYDYSNNRKEAIKTYEKGLKKFPFSGKLYLELGVVQMSEDNYNKALDYFEKGISVEPAFSSNYYWASKLFCTSSQEEVWGMIYGELFMNLERNSKRTAEISELLYNTYKSEIKIVSDTAMSVSFSKNNVISFTGELTSLRMPFGIGIYEPTLLMSIIGVKEINMESLNGIRSRFVDNYYQNGYEKRYPNVLFEYQKKIKEANHIEAYNYWILMKGDEYEFMNWQLANKDKWESFIEWFSTNPIQITTNNKFVRN